MADERRIVMPAFPGTAIKRLDLAEGYEFQERPDGGIDIVPKQGQPGGGGGGVSIKCKCIGGTAGGCKITVTGPFALCSEDGCSECAFEIEVPVPGALDYMRDMLA